MLELLHPLNAQRLWRGGTGAKGTAPTSLQWCWTWNALSAPLATSKTLQQWRPWGLANRVALGWAVTAGSACLGLNPHGRSSCIMTFSHILIQLMEWLEMLMGLELSRVMKYSGFSLVPIPAAHQRGMAALDLRAIRALCWGGAFPPRHGSNPNTSHSLQPDLGLTFFFDRAQCLVCALTLWDITAGDPGALGDWWGFGLTSHEGTCWAVMLWALCFSPLIRWQLK